MSPFRVHAQHPSPGDRPSSGSPPQAPNNWSLPPPAIAEVATPLTPNHVFLRGWSPYGTNRGIGQGDAKSLGLQVKERLPQDLQDAILSVSAPFYMNRQTVLKVVPSRIWEVRNAISESLKADPIYALNAPIYAVVEKPEWKKKKTSQVARAANVLQRHVGVERAAWVVPDFRANMLYLNTTKQTSPSTGIMPLDVSPVGKLNPDNSWRWFKGPLTQHVPELNFDNLVNDFEKSEDE